MKKNPERSRTKRLKIAPTVVDFSIYFILSIYTSSLALCRSKSKLKDTLKELLVLKEEKSTLRPKHIYGDGVRVFHCLIPAEGEPSRAS